MRGAEKMVVAVNPQGIDQDGHSLLARQIAVRQRADRLPGVKLRQRSGSYWLDGIDGNVVTLSNRMTLDELEQELTRLSRDYFDGCEGSVRPTATAGSQRTIILTGF